MTDTYLVVWFEDQSVFTLVDSRREAVSLSFNEAREDIAEFIDTREQALVARNASNPHYRYAIRSADLENFLGVVAP